MTPPLSPSLLVHLAASDGAGSWGALVSGLQAAGKTRLELMALLWAAQACSPRHSPERGLLGDLADAVLGQCAPGHVVRLPGDPSDEAGLLASVATAARLWRPPPAGERDDVLAWLEDSPRDSAADWRWLAAHGTEPRARLPDGATSAACVGVLAETATALGADALPARVELARSGVRRGRYEALAVLEPAGLWAALLALAPEPSWLVVLPGANAGRVLVGCDTTEHELLVFGRALDG